MRGQMYERKRSLSSIRIFYVMCITRRRDCTPESCATCGWLRDEVKAENARLLTIYKSDKEVKNV